MKVTDVFSGVDLAMEKRSKFSSSIGFVLAAAGSAVGLGNIWRFPYLAAKDGGGLFICAYLVLAVTFGFTMLVTEVSIGRMTKQSAMTAYGKLHPKFKWVGILAQVVPFMIFPYYCMIGGWVMKFGVTFITGHAADAAQDGYFTGFITAQTEPVLYGLLFLAITGFIILQGVNSGIERISSILMPILLILVITISIFSLTLNNGERTGLEGLKIYLVPDITGMSIGSIITVIFDAMGQLFFSISVAMGIMVTFGSYFKDEDDLAKCVGRIEICDTVVALLAGVMVIPAVYVFSGSEGMQSGGPGLMFIALPKVFRQLGAMGNIIGAIFFIMVFFAALTSAMSILETVVASLVDGLGWDRKKATLAELGVSAVLGVIICFGYNIFYFDAHLPNGTSGQILDIFDYISNYILMPVVAIGTCILIGWVKGSKTVTDEATKNGEKLFRKPLIGFMLKFASPLLLALLLLSSLGLIKLG